ncbi:MAG: prolipoprotein diacylglyceryl transferase family protein [Gemmataceae bacterium]
MRQVLFWLPIYTPWTPDGIPIYGFGLMLFVTFVVCTWLAGRRAVKVGIAKEHIQDLAIWIFVVGIIGARIVYMIQYQQPLSTFFKIWEGGLVFYGSAIGGVVGYFLAYYFILRKHAISSWKVADIVAPVAALGLSLGRVGCLLNGCCYGEVACPDCWSITYPLSAPARYPLVSQGYQTAAGFTTLAESEFNDPRTVVDQVEPGSSADQAGLRSGDKIVQVDGIANNIIVQVQGAPAIVNQLANVLRARHSPGQQALFDEQGQSALKITYGDPKEFQKDQSVLDDYVYGHGLKYSVHDVLRDHLVYNWPRGQTDLRLTVERDGQIIPLPPIQPRTLGLHPTQLYETISTLLIFLLLLAYEPFKRHDGAVMVLFMFTYAIHRFVNEMLRNDTDPVAFGMTLSQNGSILVLLAAVALAIYLWRKPAQYSAAGLPFRETLAK